MAVNGNAKKKKANACSWIGTSDQLAEKEQNVEVGINKFSKMTGKEINRQDRRRNCWEEKLTMHNHRKIILK
jgi:hypothetical protein